MRRSIIALLSLLIVAGAVVTCSRRSHLQSIDRRPVTWLLLGIDNHKNRDIFQADFISLVQVDRQGARLMAIPRGLVAYYPGCLEAKGNLLTLNLMPYYELRRRPWIEAAQRVAEPTSLGSFRRCLEIIFRTSIDHHVVIDGHGLMATVDAVGGVTVNVEKRFVESEHPAYEREGKACKPPEDYRCRLKEISFSPGPATLTGEQALAYVRSRKNEGDPGATAREGRGLQVLDALIRKSWWQRTNGALTALRYVYSDAAKSDFLQTWLDLGGITEDRITRINIGRMLADEAGATTLGGVGISEAVVHQIDSFLARHPEWCTDLNRIS